MSEFTSGMYIIVPIAAESRQALGIGPVPAMLPPPDVALRIVGPQFTDKWIIKATDDETFTVSAASNVEGESYNYKWFVQNDALYVTTRPQGDSFRFESVCNDVWVIGLPKKNDVVLTADSSVYPQLAFKPADRSGAQRFKFKAIRIDRD